MCLIQGGAFDLFQCCAYRASARHIFQPGVEIDSVRGQTARRIIVHTRYKGSKYVDYSEKTRERIKN